MARILFISLLLNFVVGSGVSWGGNARKSGVIPDKFADELEKAFEQADAKGRETREKIIGEMSPADGGYVLAALELAVREKFPPAAKTKVVIKGQTFTVVASSAVKEDEAKPDTEKKYELILASSKKAERKLTLGLSPSKIKVDLKGGENEGYLATSALQVPDHEKIKYTLITFESGRTTNFFKERGLRFVESYSHYNLEGQLSFVEPVRPVPKTLDDIYADLPEPEREQKIKTGKRTDREIITVLDLGIDYNHPDMANRILRKKDGSIEGLDLLSGSSRPYDHVQIKELDGREHGTAVASSALQDSEDLAILPIRYGFDEAYNAISYAYKLGSRIVNLSISANNESTFKGLKRAILDHPDMLFVISTMNNLEEIKEQSVYPVAYFDLPNVLIVTQCDSKGEPTNTTAYGRRTVHLAAAGNSVRLCVPGGGHALLSGASFSTGKISGIAGQMRLRDPSLVGADLKKALLQSVAWSRAWILNFPVASGGVVDEGASIEAAIHSSQNFPTHGVCKACAEKRIKRKMRSEPLSNPKSTNP